MNEIRATILIAQTERASALIPTLICEGYRVEQTADEHSLLADYARLAPSLLLLDSELPTDAVFTLCAQIRKSSRTPILMLTPDDEDIIQLAYAVGVSDVLHHPIRPVILLHRVRALIAIHQQDKDEQRVLAEALRNTASVLSSTLDQSEVLERILEQVNVVVPSESANIMLIEAGVATVAGSRGYSNRADRIPVDNLRLNVRETPTLRWMIDNNRALAIDNTDDYEGWGVFAETDPWLKSYVSAPIRIGNHVIGFLNIDSSIPHNFNATDADHLQIFADQAALAIRNARLYDRVRLQANELERRVVQRTADLEYERSQMRAIIDAMTEGVAYTEYIGGEYHTRYVNQALTQLTGYSSEEWSDQSLNLLRPRGATTEEFQRGVQEVAAALRSKGVWQQDFILTRKDGSDFDAMIIMTRVDSGDPKIIGLVTVLRDVSQEKSLQQQKERFVAYASHELRTPITNLKTRLYLMQRQPERLNEHIQVLEYVTDRMKRLVEDLLDVSRFERGVIRLKFRDIALQELIRLLVSIQQPEAERKQLTLSCDLPESPVYVHADSERLAQVLTNLLSNAINYTRDGGNIVVRVTPQGDRALVEVEDTGIGIAEDHLPHIFQPFYRVISQVEGSGLGLSITREIVELHGSKIEVTSQIGVGSNFHFWLPVSSPQPNA